MTVLLEGLGFMMTKIARSMKRALEVKLSEHGLTLGQFAVLAGLWDTDGISLSELGKKLDFDNPTITGIVDRMEREEFLERKRDDVDRRVIKVYLTPRGRRLKSVLPSLAEAVNGYAVEGFTGAEREQLKSFLDRIYSQFDNRRNG